jgi:hypothetical protein
MAASSCAAIANGLVPAFKLERPRAGFSQPRAARHALYGMFTAFDCESSFHNFDLHRL